MPQNAAGRITEPAVWLPNAIGSMPAAIAAQEPDDEPPGVCGEIVRIARHRRHHGGEFRGRGLADDDAAGAARQRHRGGISAWLKAGINRRAVLGREIGGIENVLEPYRQPTQRRRRQFCIFRRLTRRDQVEDDKGADLLVARRNRLGAHVDDRARREFAGFDAAGEIEGGKHGNCRHRGSGIRDQDGAEAGST